MADTRIGWSTIVTPDDLDAHMLAIGQVEANAALVTRFFEEARMPARSRVYVPGAGTGQIFEFIPKTVFVAYDFLFADLRADFLEQVERRMPRETYFRTQVDDVEDSWIDVRFDAAIIVLLLEHVDWCKALTEILETLPEHVFVVLQRNLLAGAAAPMVTTARELRPSIREFAHVAKSELVDAEMIVLEMSTRGFRLATRNEKEVPDSKTMIGLRFIRHT